MVDYVGRGNAVKLSSAGQVADGIAGKRKTDDCNGGSDDNGRHNLGNPLYARYLNNYGDNDINQSGKNRTENEAEIAKSHGNASGKGGGHGADKGKGRAEKYRAFELGKEQINDCTDTCAEKGGRGGQSVADNVRHGNGCSHNGKKLLEGKNQQLAELRPVFNVIDQFHIFPPILRLSPFLLFSADVNSGVAVGFVQLDRNNF